MPGAMLDDYCATAIYLEQEVGRSARRSIAGKEVALWRGSGKAGISRHAAVHKCVKTF